MEYGRVIKTLKKEKNWLVYHISAAGDTVSTLLALLASELLEAYRSGVLIEKE